MTNKRGAVSDEQAVTVVKDEPNTAVAVTVVPSAESMNIVKEALGAGESLSVDLLKRAKWPAAGAQHFSWVDGSQPVPFIEGVMILRHPVRVFWQKPFTETGGGTPPDCFSMDNTLGHGDRGLPGDDTEGDGAVHECATCPFADWGTAVNEKGEPAAGKACRQVTRTFILQEGHVLPTLVPVPPSSYKKALVHTVGLSAENKSYYRDVVTRISTEPTKSRGGIAYAIAKFEVVRETTPEERAAIQSYRDGILPFLNNLSVVDVEATEV